MPARSGPRIAVALSLFASDRACAVAGGGGGGFDIGGSDDGIGMLIELLFWVLLELPFPLNLAAIAVVLGIAWLANSRYASASGLNRVASAQSAVLAADSFDPAFLHRNPGFDGEAFRARVRDAFLAIQDAWSRQDLKPVRRWISDGVWQRFHAQFAMMALLGQQNRVSAVEVRKVFCDRIEQDGAYDIVHVGIVYAAQDDFVSARFPQFDQRGRLERVEFWSFIRRSGVAGGDLLASSLCPACGAPLPDDLGEVAACRNCGAVSTLGDYDWVLAEITQADDYANTRARHDAARFALIRRALGADPAFSVQHVEDRAANAWMQIVGARVAREPARLRRFVGDALFGRLAAAIGSEAPVVFNRLYLNHVTLIDHFRQDEGGRPADHLVFALRMTAQRVDVSAGELVLVDRAPFASDEVMVLSREVGAEPATGSLYTHRCPSCGGPVADTLDVTCAYCGNVLNSTRREWIVSRLMRADEYRAVATVPPIAEEPAEGLPVAGLATGFASRPDEIDPVFKARDFAFNNVMAVLGSDGAVSSEEVAFAQVLARRLRYGRNKVSDMVFLAIQRRLPIRIPEDSRTAARMLRAMEKAAAADGAISSAERAVIDQVRQRILGAA